MGVIYAAEGSQPETPFLMVASGNAWILGAVLEVPDSYEGVLPTSTILEKIRVARDRIERHPEFMEGLLCRPTEVYQIGNIKVISHGIDLDRIKRYLDKLEEIAGVAGPDGFVAWG